MEIWKATLHEDLHEFLNILIPALRMGRPIYASYSQTIQKPLFDMYNNSTNKTYTHSIKIYTTNFAHPQEHKTVFTACGIKY